MKTLTIKRKIRFPIFGIWKWKKRHYRKPLLLSVQQAKVRIYIHEERFLAKSQDPVPSVFGHIEMEFSPPPRKLLQGLQGTGQPAVDAATRIHEIYFEAHEKFESLLMSAGKVKSLLSRSPMSFHEFFEMSGRMLLEDVEWKVDDEPYRVFHPTLQRRAGRHSLYTSAQLVTPARWQRIQEAADDGDIPNEELLELMHIRSKAVWRQPRVATIEASIISESLLRTYSLRVLEKRGFSSTKIKQLKDELSFNNLLNVVLPLSLTKTELRRVSSSIQAVDVLRGIRNDLVHGKITDKDINEENVMKGIDGALKLAEFLKRKIEEATS